MTNKKSLIFYIILILFCAISFSYSLVFALPENIQTNFKNYNLKSISNNIFLDSIELNSNLIFTKESFSNYKIDGDCSAFGEYIGKSGEYNIFKIKILDYNCKKEKINLNFHLDNALIKKEFNLISEYNLYSINLDKKTESLELLVKYLKNKQIKTSENNKISNISKLKKDRKIKEYKYLTNFINNILEKRKLKYKIPVIGAELPNRFTKLPNSPRPYRKDYTDNFHHGWDFDTEKGTSVVALDDGIIVRIIDGFKFEDLDKINHSKILTYEQRLENLNILRGNQVWLKTMKGDVAFYSHLDNVSPNIKVGDVISRGEELGTVGVTGVPDRDYTDFHLHFPIQKNPLIDEKAGKYTFMDYMKWDWMMKGKKFEEELKYQYNVFE